MVNRTLVVGVQSMGKLVPEWLTFEMNRVRYVGQWRGFARERVTDGILGRPKRGVHNDAA